jgi:hypothetical protein
MPKLTEAVVKDVHDALSAYSRNKLAGEAQTEGLNLCQDITDFCLGGQWGNLPLPYQRAWAGEIIRRVRLIIPDVKTVLVTEPKKLTQLGVITLLTSDSMRHPSPVERIYFSQFSVNRHFQGGYIGQPPWLSDKEILEVAKTLRGAPEKSADLRIRLYAQGGKWMALNNRGFALHCLANVVPRRLAFDTHLSSDEQSRLNKGLEDMGLNFSESIPSSRRNWRQWEAQIPTSVTAVPETKNSRKVIYTIRAIGMSVSGGPDAGNETVYNNA